MNRSLSWAFYLKIKNTKGKRWKRFKNNFVYTLGNLNKLLCIYALRLLDVMNSIESHLSLIILTHKAVLVCTL